MNLDIVRIYFVISFILALVFSFLAKRKVQKKCYLPLFILFLFFSFLNPIFSLFFFFYIFRYAIKGEKELLDSIKEEEVWAKPFIGYSKKFGEASLSILPLNKEVPLETREELLVLLNQYKNPENIDLVKKLLESKEDEIRLLGYGIIDKLETKINKKIESLLEKYYLETNRKEKALYAKEIAYAFWEFLYYRLVDLELEKIILGKIKNFLKEAQSSFPKDRECLVLQGRIALREKKYLEAISWFKQAQQEKAYIYSYLPYLVEAYFGVKDFLQVKKLICETKELAEHPRLSSIWRLWL